MQPAQSRKLSAPNGPTESMMSYRQLECIASSASLHWARLWRRSMNICISWARSCERRRNAAVQLCTGRLFERSRAETICSMYLGGTSGMSDVRCDMMAMMRDVTSVSRGLPTARLKLGVTVFSTGTVGTPWAGGST